MHGVGLHVQCKVVSAYELAHHNSSGDDFNQTGARKGGAANGRLAYGSTGSVIPDA
ncbi:hypothetical protein T09_14848 [Trichinella sp. T9]|nr:hypothetical protein T09_14848 [Trichinella sp. T9]